MLQTFLKRDPAMRQRPAEGVQQGGQRAGEPRSPPSLQALQIPGMLPNLSNITDLGHFLTNHVGGASLALLTSASWISAFERR